MHRPTYAERAARREAARADEDTVVKRYRAGGAAAALAREFQVNAAWLAEQFHTWGVPRRDRSTATIYLSPRNKHTTAR